MAVSRIIFNQRGTDDSEIEELLDLTLELRREINDREGQAAAYNSFGSLYEGQLEWALAEKNFAKSLDIRQKLYDAVKPEMVRERKRIAQQVEWPL